MSASSALVASLGAAILIAAVVIAMQIFSPAEGQQPGAAPPTATAPPATASAVPTTVSGARPTSRSRMKAGRLNVDPDHPAKAQWRSSCRVPATARCSRRSSRCRPAARPRSSTAQRRLQLVLHDLRDLGARSDHAQYPDMHQPVIHRWRAIASLHRSTPKMGGALEGLPQFEARATSSDRTGRALPYGRRATSGWSDVRGWQMSDVGRDDPELDDGTDIDPQGRTGQTITISTVIALVVATSLTISASGRLTRPWPTSRRAPGCGVPPGARSTASMASPPASRPHEDRGRAERRDRGDPDRPGIRCCAISTPGRSARWT